MVGRQRRRACCWQRAGTMTREACLVWSDAGGATRAPPWRHVSYTCRLSGASCSGGGVSGGVGGCSAGCGSQDGSGGACAGGCGAGDRCVGPKSRTCVRLAWRWRRRTAPLSGAQVAARAGAGASCGSLDSWVGSSGRAWCWCAGPTTSAPAVGLGRRAAGEAARAPVARTRWFGSSERAAR